MKQPKLADARDKIHGKPGLIVMHILFWSGTNQSLSNLTLAVSICHAGLPKFLLTQKQ